MSIRMTIGSSLAALAATATFGLGEALAVDNGAVAELQAVPEVVVPDVAPLPAASPMSQEERDALRQGLEDRREATSGGRPVTAPSAEAESHHAGPQTRPSPESEANRITRNFRNTRAQAVSSTLAEPAAANDANEVFYGGNTYFSRSSNHGASWVGEAIPGGPADAPFACCDSDAVHHGPLDTTFNIVMYLNSARTNGIIRIFVRRGSMSPVDCTYSIDPGGTGTLVPDYPHIATSNNFLYLTTNNLRPSGWAGSQIRRFNAAQMANCQSGVGQTVTYTGTDGQRVLTPVENASTTQYFGLNRSSTLFRVLRWPEGAASVTAFDRNLGHATQFINSDCRGGTGNFDMIERSTSWSISGFRLRGAVVPGNRLWFLWNAGSDGSHPQAHLHSAILSEPGLALLPSPPVHNPQRCFGYPSLGANGFGEFGLTFAHGGRKGGGGTPAQGAIAVDDAGSAGNFFPTFTTTAIGTHNRSDGRFGDYFTIRRNDKCPSFGWAATNYALLNGNSAASHVNARYVELQSSTRPTCP